MPPILESIRPVELATVLDIDVIDTLAGLHGNSPVAALRRDRGEVRLATQGSFDALFEPQDPEGLPLVERELVALRVAQLQKDVALSEFHLHRAQVLGATAGQVFAVRQASPEHQGKPRWSGILRFVDRLTLHPASAQPKHLRELELLGLGARDIVTLAQLVAFVNYEVRLLSGLRALALQPRPPLPPQDLPAGVSRGNHPPVERHHPYIGYTQQPLEWSAWLNTVDPAHASPDQVAVLDESNPAARSSPYYLTLIHNPAVLRQRSRLFNAIMYGAGGLPRAEREFTTLAVSLVNGCPYCASVHSRLFGQLSKTPELAQALFDDGVNAELPLRLRGLVDLAVDLSANPPKNIAPRADLLKASGLNDAQILDAVHATAIFAWANRLMQTLGEPVEPTGR